MPRKSKATVESRYFEAICKAFNISIGGHIFLGMLFGIFGTFAFGLIGAAFYFILMITGIAVKCRAAECIKQNREDIRLFVYSIITFFIIILEVTNVAFVVTVLSFHDDSFEILSFKPIYITAFSAYIIYILFIFAVVFLWVKRRFDPQKYQIENIEKSKWVKIGGILAPLGAGGCGALGRIVAKITHSLPISAVLLGSATIYLDIIFFAIVAYYILMYRFLKNKPAGEQEPQPES
jgi:hypothetical protein